MKYTMKADKLKKFIVNEVIDEFGELLAEEGIEERVLTALKEEWLHRLKEPQKLKTKPNLSNRPQPTTEIQPESSRCPQPKQETKANTTTSKRRMHVDVSSNSSSGSEWEDVEEVEGANSRLKTVAINKKPKVSHIV